METPQVNIRLSVKAKKLIASIVSYEEARDAMGRTWTRTSVIEMAVREAAAKRGLLKGAKSG
jgi:hypothetical protein